MALLTLNSHDYTKYIVSGSYKVNVQDQYESWTDGNGVTHRQVYRSKVSGSFNMKFINRSVFNTFLSDLAAVKANGYYPMTLYVNNALAASAHNMFVTIEPEMDAIYTDYPEMSRFTVKVVER